MRRILLVAMAIAMLLIVGVPQGAQAGDITLHPSGFGEHSYAAWKAHEGLPDSGGNKDQALYFQKMTSTATFAAAFAVFEGVAGMETAELGDLAFWYRDDGHCGAGAPRFNVRIQPPAGPRQTLFFGCNSGMVPGDTRTDDEGRVWFERRLPAGTIPPGDVVSLSIAYDEGTELPPGFVYLDDIEAADHLWTSATDNGSGGFTTANSPVTAAEAEAILGEPLSVVFGS
jgi:hypothetical protein